jgi:hypothetical protein
LYLNPKLWTLAQILAGSAAKMCDDVAHNRRAMTLSHPVELRPRLLLAPGRVVNDNILKRACDVGRRSGLKCPRPHLIENLSLLVCERRLQMEIAVPPEQEAAANEQ